jgi:hypothetical protein
MRDRSNLYFRLGVDLVKLLHFIRNDIDRDFKTITFERTLVLSDDGLVIKQGLKTQQRRVHPCCDGLQVFLKSIAPEEIVGIVQKDHARST